MLPDGVFLSIGENHIFGGGSRFFLFFFLFGGNGTIHCACFRADRSQAVNKPNVAGEMSTSHLL